jgi:predicted AlkP superfamily pyrophosphatase or phosphodiesterase
MVFCSADQATAMGKFCVFIASTPFLIALLGGCQPTTRNLAEDRPPPLLLISIDGFRHDYYDLADTPTLDRLISGGLKADSLHHVFPTKTFPTHYSMVTGRHPGTHGIVANNMWDRKRKPPEGERFSLGNRDAVGDGYWYQDGEPIWVSAERQGLIAATYFWPGSEARIHRMRPTYWKPYAGGTPHLERVEQVLSWLDLPADQRPDFYTLYFSTVDSLGHRHGPRADPVRDALIDVDHHLGVLLDGLQSRGLLDQMHIILVSDHGMSQVDFDRYIMLDDYLDLSRVVVSDWGPAAQIWATDMSVDEIISALDGAHPHLRVWKREDIPERYRFGSHHRVPDVLAEADLEWMISNKPYMAGRSRFSLLGMHGWDPAWLEMHGAFLIHGPRFADGDRAPAVRSIDLYALMSHLLGIEPAAHEGSLDPFLPYLDAARPQHYEILSITCDRGLVELEARVGPAHMALHWNERAHVLDRITRTDGLHFEEVDLLFTQHADGLEIRIDEHHWSDCQVM